MPEIGLIKEILARPAYCEAVRREYGSGSRDVISEEEITNMKILLGTTKSSREFMQKIGCENVPTKQEMEFAIFYKSHLKALDNEKAILRHYDYIFNR